MFFLNHLAILFVLFVCIISMQRAMPALKNTITKQKSAGIFFLPPKIQGGSISRLFDLSFILYFCALFSLILINKFIIGGNISYGINVFLYSTIISITTVSLLTFMWYIGKGYLGIGVGALICLLLISIEPDGQDNLWLPIIVLSFTSATMWIYELRFSFRNILHNKNKTLSISILLIIILSSIPKLGYQYHYNLLQDENTPKRFSISKLDGNYKVIENENSRIFVDQNFKKDRSINEQRLLYSILSDINLVDNYRGNYIDFLERVNEFKSEKQQEEENDSFVSGDYLNRLNLQEGQKIRYVKGIENKFKKLSYDDQVRFLNNRFNWIYPFGRDDQTPVISLPAIKSSNRLNEIVNSRICNILLDEIDSGKEIENYRNLFEYSSESIPVKELAKDSPERLAILYGQRKGSECTFPRNLFPLNEDSSHINSLLKDQLLLPIEEENYLAFIEYNMLLEPKIDDNKIRSFLEDFKSKLEDKPNSQGAFVEFFTNQNKLENYEIFNQLITNGLKFNEENLKINDNKVSTNNRVVEKISTSDDSKDENNKSLKENVPIDNNNSFDLRSDKGILTLLDIIDNNKNDLVDYKCSETSIDRIASKCLNSREAQKLANLLNTASRNYNVYHIFYQEIVDLITRINEISSSKQRLLNILNNPILNALVNENYLEKTFPDDSSYDDVKNVLGNFYYREYNPPNINTNIRDFEEREQYLHDISFSLYGSGGKYSHDSLSRIAVTITLVNRRAGILIACLLQSPFPILGIVFGRFAAHKLIKREKLESILSLEKSHQIRSRYSLGTTDILRGRQNTISEMKKRAGRGWSSIAVVGRRGIGKTRVLYALMKEDKTDSHESIQSISAWVSAPTQFNEAEFIESVLESLTADIEYVISDKLGAKPLEIRRIEKNQTIIGAITYILCILLLFFISNSFVFGSASTSTSDQVAGTTLTLGTLMVCSFACLFFHCLSLQPINLASWLERDQGGNSQTALLYREMNRIRTFLDTRRKSLGFKGNEKNVSYPKLIFINTLVIVFALLFGLWGLGFIVLSTLNPSLISFSRSDIIIILSIGALVVIISLLALTREVIKIRGYSLMSLVSEYREFVEKVVYRIRNNALGPRPNEDFEVIICIDELDKIIDQDELRKFIRRIKVIFEIPGVYYYLSLSEDALKSFYLGTTEGKNEIDSAFDHVIYVPPLNCDLGEKIAQSYLNKHSYESRHPRLERMIAAASYGVPRDILRRCDELIARGDLHKIQPAYVSDSLRLKLATLAYGEERLSKQEQQIFSGKDVDKVIEYISAIVSKLLNNHKAPRVVLGIWLLALLSIANDLVEEQWIQVSERLRDIGFKISDESIPSLIEDLESIQQDILIP